MTDEELLTDYLRTKDRESSATLYERMRDRLYFLALHMIHSPADAEDVVQTVFCKLCKVQPQEIRSADGFLKTMTKRAVIDHQRKEHGGVRDGMISLDAFGGANQWRAKDMDDWIEHRTDFNPEPFVRSSDATIQKEAHEEVKKAMDHLTRKQREAIELYHCRDLEPGHIAEILDVKEATVRSRIRRGILKLQKKLASDAPVKPVRPHLRPLRAVDPNTGVLVHEFSRVKDAVSAGVSSDCLYRALRKGTLYKGLKWSYANAV